MNNGSIELGDSLLILQEEIPELATKYKKRNEDEEDVEEDVSGAGNEQSFDHLFEED